MSDHTLKIEFNRPTKWNLEMLYDGDDKFDLYFTNIKGSFYMTMENSYDNIYFEDEVCNFSDGEMKASVDITDLIESIANGEYRQTNGKAVSDWISRLVGDYTNKDTITFNGYNYADGGRFWGDFFDEMPKDEIKDFMKFCESYISLPNIEVDTVSQKWDLDDDGVVLDYNRQYSMTINDDLTIEQVESFKCDSVDATVTYQSNLYDEDYDDEYYESKGKNKKSLKERQFTGNEIVLQFDKNGDCLGFDFESLQNCLENYGFDSLAMLEIAMKKLNNIVKDLNILDYMA